MKMITTMTLVAAVAATLSTPANAIAVSGSVTNMQITWANTDILADPNASFYGMTIGGDTETGLTLSGYMVGFISGNWIGLDWNLTDGMRQGINGAGGTIFQGGTLSITTSTDGITFTDYQVYDAPWATDFLAGQDGDMVPCPGQCTAGLVVDDAGYGTLPGLWDLTFFGAGWNNAAGGLTIFGDHQGIFMEGSVAPVPVPAAGWLFGSALLGLAGFANKRRSN